MQPSKKIQVEEFVQSWLNEARRAPSGGNAQPWRVRAFAGSEFINLELTIDPEYHREASVMDVQGAASVLALGALAFNLEVLANLDGFKLLSRKVKVSQDFWGGRVLLEFQRGLPGPLLFTREDILNRRTDRGSYSSADLPLAFHQGLDWIKQKYPALELKSFKKNRLSLIKALRKIEWVRWQSELYLKSMLDEISFPNESATGDKIPSTQLGVNRLDQAFLFQLKKKSFLRKAFRATGLAIMPALKAVAPGIRHAESLHFLQARQFDFESCFELGQCFQQIWVMANKSGISFQPVANSFIAFDYLHAPELTKWSPKAREKLRLAADEMEKKFGVDLKKFTIGFRVGQTLRIAEMAPRKELRAEYVNERQEIF